MINKDLIELNSKIKFCVDKIFFENKRKILSELYNVQEEFKNYYLKTGEELNYKSIDLNNYLIKNSDLLELDIVSDSSIEREINEELIIRYKKILDEVIEYYIYESNNVVNIYIDEKKFKKEDRGDKIAEMMLIIVLSSIIVIALFVFACGMINLAIDPTTRLRFIFIMITVIAWIILNKTNKIGIGGNLILALIISFTIIMIGTSIQNVTKYSRVIDSLIIY